MKGSSARPPKKEEKPEKFNFEKMKQAATHADSVVRKKTFIEYFERFAEFPSYLFDNERQIDSRLAQTIQDILKDGSITQEMKKGIDSLLHRLPS